VWYGKSYYRLLIGNHTLAFDWCHFWWPWSTFEGHFSLGCHFHIHFSNPWHAITSHGLPAIAELLVTFCTVIEIPNHHAVAYANYLLVFLILRASVSKLIGKRYTEQVYGHWSNSIISHNWRRQHAWLGQPVSDGHVQPSIDSVVSQ